LSLRRISELWSALAALLLGVCLFAGLGAIGLVGPDEPRYVSIARAMARTGDWLTPRLWGHAWFEKPILYYWSAAASFHLFGVSERAARLPNALAALAGALLLGWAAQRLYGARAALLALVLFPTSIGLFAFAHAATMDMPLAMSVAAAMVAALFVLWPAKVAGRRRIWLALVGAFIGLGVLAKGPVAIILAGGSVLLWAAVTRRWRDAIRFLRWESLAAFGVVALPWYVACSLANPDFARAFLWHQNVQRFLTPVFEHVQPWWFFVPVLALGLLPWTPLLLATVHDGWRVFRSGRAAESPAVFVACWAAFPLLFFSFSESKLPGYILPAVPPLIFLLARTVDRIPRAREGETGGARRDRLGQWTVALVGLAFIALAVTAGHWLRRLPRSWDVAHHGAILGFLAATVIAGIVVVVLAAWGRPRGAVAGSALWMGVLVAAVSWLFLPQVGPYLSARDAAAAARPLVEPGATIEVYKLSRDWAYGLNYYFGHRLPEWSPSEAGPVWVYTTKKALPAIEQGHALSRSIPLHRGIVLVRVSPAAP
jgi:4-amino-4-deoxy-L-arabinose transferase-like glycosyltransferase